MLVGSSLSSATPAREALQALRVEGFLQLAPGRGFQVAPLTGQDIRDLFTAQSLIAGELAARAARYGDDAGMKELEALHHELIAAAARGEKGVLEEKNHLFHRQINLTASAPRIAWTLTILTRYVPHRFYADIPGWSRATVTDHEAILRAVVGREPEKAREAMQQHILHAGDLLADHFDTRG
jgi:DNA-binding GntR family transcriptional regulator